MDIQKAVRLMREFAPQYSSDRLLAAIILGSALEDIANAIDNKRLDMPLFGETFENVAMALSSISDSIDNKNT